MFIRRTPTRRNADGAAYHTFRLVESRREGTRVRLPTLLNLGSAFVQRSWVFDGNAVEGRTLEALLTDLSAPSGALVVMDRGIATEANLTWLKEPGYRYLVMRREAQRMAPEGETTLTTAWAGITKHPGHRRGRPQGKGTQVGEDADGGDDADRSRGVPARGTPDS